MDTERTFETLSQRDKRSLIFNLLYAAESFDYEISVESIIDNFNRGFDCDIPIDSEVITTVNNIVSSQDELDAVFKPLLSNWRFERIGVATRLILRFAIWELLNTQTDPTIVINEAIELAKCYAEKDAYKFINGILDEIVKRQDRQED